MTSKSRFHKSRIPSGFWEKPIFDRALSFLQKKLNREKFIYSSHSYCVMSLDDFLRSCKEKGYTPLNYSKKTKFADGSEYEEEFRNGAYAGVNAGRAGFRAGNRREQAGSSQHERDERIDDVVSELYGSEVVIRTPQGFHYGELQSYDGKFFYLKSYCFSRKSMSTFEYGAKSIFSEDAVVPARDIVSVGEIPMVVNKGKEEPWEAISKGSEYRNRF